MKYNLFFIAATILAFTALCTKLYTKTKQKILDKSMKGTFQGSETENTLE